jgi:hypothetical protein
MCTREVNHLISSLPASEGVRSRSETGRPNSSGLFGLFREKSSEVHCILAPRNGHGVLKIGKLLISTSRPRAHDARSTKIFNSCQSSKPRKFRSILPGSPDKIRCSYVLLHAETLRKSSRISSTRTGRTSPVPCTQPSVAATQVMMSTQRGCC